MKRFLPAKPRAQAGFTMIELLIVLTIVTIVALLVANNINEAIAQARDVERRNDLDNIQRALESYWHENEAYPQDINALSIAAEFLTDPSGTPIDVVPASNSINKPASSYKASKPQVEEPATDDDSPEATSQLKPAAEYTYATYDCRSEDSQTIDDEGNEKTVTELKCYKYVLYSWLEKVEDEEIPYELNNLHEPATEPASETATSDEAAAHGEDHGEDHGEAAGTTETTTP